VNEEGLGVDRRGEVFTGSISSGGVNLARTKLGKKWTFASEWEITLKCEQEVQRHCMRERRSRRKRAQNLPAEVGKAKEKIPLK